MIDFPEARKTALRAVAKADRDALHAGIGAAAGIALAARFYGAPELRAAIGRSTVVAGYLPIGSEIDTPPLLDRLDRERLRLCQPAPAHPAPPMTFPPRAPR